MAPQLICVALGGLETEVTVPAPLPAFLAVKGTLTVKLLALVAVPLGVVTLSAPLVAPAGTVATITVSEVTEKLAPTVFNVTAVAPVKFAPLIVTLLPTSPLAGVKLEIVGGLRWMVTDALAGAAEMVAPLLASVPVAPAENVAVPTVLLAVHAQVKSCAEPPGMFADAGVAEGGQVAPAPPIVNPEGATAFAVAWPEFDTESVTVSGLPWKTGFGAAVSDATRLAGVWFAVSVACQSRMSTGKPESRSGYTFTEVHPAGVVKVTLTCVQVELLMLEMYGVLGTMSALFEAS